MTVPNIPEGWCALGVGDGRGQLFVYGPIDAISACREKLLASAAPVPPAAACDCAIVPDICNAYESGVGHRGRPTADVNPYPPGTPQHSAYQIGAHGEENLTSVNVPAAAVADDAAWREEKIRAEAFADGVLSATAKPAAVAEVQEWTRDRPTEPGAYWVRGWMFGEPHLTALVEVSLDETLSDEEEGAILVCNLHEKNSDTEIESWSPISSMSDRFEWLGPLSATPAPVAPAAVAEVQDDVAEMIRGPHNACMFKETCCRLLATPAPVAQKVPDEVARFSGDCCPECGAPEQGSNTPRTVYFCGSSDYDGRPGTMIQSSQCLENAIRAATLAAAQAQEVRS